MLNEFVLWFESDSPNFVGMFGKVISFYDKQLDQFQIQEIQDAYESFKMGFTPSSLYHSWGNK